jgi:hypothetical protein
MALALTAYGEHDGLRLLPIAGPGASQNAVDVMLTHGIDFGVVQTDALMKSSAIRRFLASRSTWDTSRDYTIDRFKS